MTDRDLTRAQTFIKIREQHVISKVVLNGRPIA